MKENRNTLYYLAALVSVITLAVYVTSLRNDFVEWDDNTYIFENPYIRSLDAVFFKWAFFDFYEANWHPLTWISHALDYAVWGLNPAGHHLTNVILHSANSCVVVLLIAALIKAYKEKTPEAGVREFLNERTILIAGGVTGILFGLHPLHVESAAWVAERKDLLCALFFLLAVILYLQYADGQEIEDRRQGAEEKIRCETGRKIFFADKRYIFSLGLFVLALMSKPMAVSLPVVLLILDWHPLNKVRSLSTFRIALVEKLPFIAFSVISSILTILAQRAGDAIQSIERFSLSTRLPVAADSLIAYLGKMVLPFNLIPYYPYPEDVSLLSIKYVLAIALVVGITTTCALMIKKHRVWLTVWGYYIVTLLPVIGIVQVGGQAMADRYTYLPSIGPFLLMGLSVAQASEKMNSMKMRGQAVKHLGALTAIFVLVSLTYLTMKQIGIWRNSLIFWNYAIENEPEKVPRSYYARGVVYFKMGLADNAIKDFDKAIALDPFYHEAYQNRGIAFDAIGLRDKAMQDFDTAVAVSPSYSKAYYSRGILLSKMGLLDKARQDFDTAISLNPSNHDAYNNRGLLFEDTGENDKAIADYEKAIVLNPFFYGAHINRGVLYGKAGLFDKAVECFDKSITIDPKQVDAYINRGFAYFLSGQYNRATEDFTTAIALDQNSAAGYFNRGNVSLRTGDKRLAAADFQNACALGSADGCKALHLLDGSGK